MITLIQYVAALLIFWFLGLGGIFFFPKDKRSYIKNYILVSAYFIIASFIAIYFFQKILISIYLKLTFFPLVIFTLFSLFNFLEYFFSNKLLEKPVKILEEYSDTPFLSLDYRYLISKSFEIFYQQILVVVLVYFLKTQGLNTYLITLVFVMLFGFGHIPTLKMYKKNFIGFLVFVAALLSSFFFPYLILHFRYGFVYTYILHWLFYTNTGLLFWLINQINPEIIKVN